MIKKTSVLSHFLILAGMMLLGWALATALSLLLAHMGVDISGRSALLVLQAVSQLLVFLLPSLLYLRFYHRGDTGFLGCSCGAHQWLQALLGVIVILLLTPAVDWVATWNDSWHWSGGWSAVEEALRAVTAQVEAMTQQMLTMPHWTDLVICLLVVALIPAVCEELLFRGIVQRSFERQWGNVHVSIWVTALLFSLFHGEVFALLPRLLLGAALGYLYARSGSLLVNSVAHFVNNATIVVLYYLNQHGVVMLSPDEPLALPALLTLCCTVAAVVVIWFITSSTEMSCKQR